MLTQGPRGTQDILPTESYKWQHLERLIRQICREYGYKEIRTPIFEHTELFLRGVGDTTDIVEKEMYSFQDRGEREITLRPEGTAGTVRAYVQHKLYADPAPQKVFYIGPMFRYGRPQAGRLRQFHQFGIEAFGASDPLIDAEVITLAMDFYQRLGLKNLELLLNSVGCPNCRPKHRQALQDFLRPRLNELCELCQGRFERNPMRILDCKNAKCQELSQEAPTTTQCLCEECSDHLERVKAYMTAAGIPFTIDERLVRGLDYYTKTAFEIVSTDIGAQSSIGGGGRYDGLVAEIGGPENVQGIGFGLGLERILLTMENQGIPFADPYGVEVFIATVGQEQEVKAKAFFLANQLRKQGLAVELDYGAKSLKAQMKSADRHRAKHVVILGTEELAKGVAIVREMGGGDQLELPIEQIAGHLLAAWY